MNRRLPVIHGITEHDAGPFRLERLDLEFANGERRRFEMGNYLHYPAFSALQDPALFQRAHVEHGTVVWTDEIDLSPDTLYLRGQSVPEGAV